MRVLKIIAAAITIALLATSAGAEGLVRWHDSLEAAKQAAAESGRPILVEFHSVGCGPCARLEQETLADPEVATVIGERFEAVRVDSIKQPELATQYLVSFYPTVKFVDADGVVVHDAQGFVAAADFLGVMDRALNAHAALQRARPAAAEQPQDAAGALPIARDFYVARQYEQAAEWARTAAERAEDVSAVAGEAQYILGAALTDGGEPGRAVQPLVNALRLADGAAWQWDARLKLGYAWLQRGEDDSGIGMLQTVYASEAASAEHRADAKRLLQWWGVEVD